jgi:hypothetical protein
VQQHMAEFVGQGLAGLCVRQFGPHDDGAGEEVGDAVRSLHAGVRNLEVVTQQLVALVLHLAGEAVDQPGRCLALEQGGTRGFGQLGSVGLADVFSRDFVILV